MAWTSPRTWTDGELVNASLLNTHLRDNLNALTRSVAVRTTTDQNTSSTTFADVGAIILPLGASEVWTFHGLFMIGANTGAGCKIGWSLPSGCDGYWAMGFMTSAGTYQSQASQTTAGGADQMQLTSVATNSGGQAMFVEGIFANDTTPGNAQLRFASQAGASVTFFGASGQSSSLTAVLKA